MAKRDKSGDWYARLNRIFRGPAIKRRIRDYRQPPTSTALELFSKTQSFVYSNAINSYGQYDRLSISSDTLIAVPGTEKFKTLSQLIDQYGESGEKFIVYAYDHNKHRIVPAWAHHPRITGVKDTVKVTFDDGSTLVCTPDHECMLRDGTYRDAQDLQPGDSMMPFYRKQFAGSSKIDGKKFNGYHSVYTMASNDEGAWNGWQPEHVLVAEWSSNRKVVKGNEHVHHIDHDPCNNDPDNLCVMDAVEHLRMHGKDAKLRWQDADIRGRMITGIQQAWDNDDGTRRAVIADVNRRDDVREKRRQHCLTNSPSKRQDVKYKIGRATSEYYVVKKEQFFKLDVSLVRDELDRHHAGDVVSFAKQYKVNPSVMSGWLDARRIEHKRVDVTHTSVNFTKYWSGKKRSQEWKTSRSGAGNVNFVGEFTIDDFTAAHVECGTDHRSAAKYLNVSVATLTRRLRKFGYKGWTGFVASLNTTHSTNHKVVSVEFYKTLPCGDLTVDGYENFATDTIIVHNSRYADFSEMLYTPEISAAVDIYADETVSQDETGKVLQIYSDNRKVRRLLEDLFYDTLNVDFNLRMWVLNLVKFGDFFLFNDIAPGYGVMQVFPVPVNEIEREEGFDPEDPMAVRFRWVTQGNVALENWQLTHFRILGNDAFLPYGSSIIEPARRIWRQLVLIEDAMLVYRVVRSPERRIFYIDVGGIPPEEVPNYMAAQEAKLRSSTLVDRSTGRIDFRNNPLETLEDYFIPVRGTESGTKIDTLAGGQHVSATEDVEYIQKKLFAALKIPRAYLGYDEMLSSKATLAQEDIRFSRTIQQIQKVIISELQRLAYIHLFMNGYEGDDMFDFELKLNNPSSIAQQQKLELFARKFEIIGSALSVDEGKVFSTPFLLRSIMTMSEQQQRNMHAEVVDDVQRRAALAKISEGATPESVGFKSGGGFTPAGGAGGEPGITDDELPGAEELPESPAGDDAEAGDEGGDEGDEALDDLFAHNAPEGKLVVEDETQSTSAEPRLEGSYDSDEDKDSDESRESDPVRVSMHAQASKNKQANRKRSQTRHGPGETHMPDFGRMTSMRDAQDDMTSRSEVGTNPLRDILSMKLETLERFGNDIRFAPEKARLHEKLDALSFLDNYMSDAEPDPEPMRPRMTTSLRAVFDRLENVFGEELQRARGDGMSGVLTEAATDSIDDILDEVIGTYKGDVLT